MKLQLRVWAPWVEIHPSGCVTLGKLLNPRISIQFPLPLSGNNTCLRGIPGIQWDFNTCTWQIVKNLISVSCYYYSHSYIIKKKLCRKMSICLHMLLLLLGWPFSYSLNVQSANCAIDPALLLWLLKAPSRQNTLTRYCGVAAAAALPRSRESFERMDCVWFVSIFLECSRGVEINFWWDG